MYCTENANIFDCIFVQGRIQVFWKGGSYVDMAVVRWSYLIFLKYPMEMKFFGPIETKLFNFIMIIIKGGGGREGGLSGPPEPL